MKPRGLDEACVNLRTCKAGQSPYKILTGQALEERRHVLASLRVIDWHELEAEKQSKRAIAQKLKKFHIVVKVVYPIRNNSHIK